MPVKAKYRGDSWTIPLSEILPSYNTNGISPEPSCLVLKDGQLVSAELSLIYRSLGVQRGQVMIGGRTNNVQWNGMPLCMVMCSTDSKKRCRDQILLPLLLCISSILLIRCGYYWVWRFTVQRGVCVWMANQYLQYIKQTRMEFILYFHIRHAW